MEKRSVPLFFRVIMIGMAWLLGLMVLAAVLVPFLPWLSSIAMRFVPKQCLLAHVDKREAKMLGMRMLGPNRMRFYFDREPSEFERCLVTESFIASVAIPTQDLWVNLQRSNPEKIVPVRLGLTKLGAWMLYEDVVLKQLVATEMHPKYKNGSDYWKTLADLNKGIDVDKDKGIWRNWIVPKDVKIRDCGLAVVIESAELGVNSEAVTMALNGWKETYDRFILPEVRKQVKTNKGFANLRMINRAVICGIWFKSKFAESPMYKEIINSGKVAGIETIPQEYIADAYNYFVGSLKGGFWSTKNINGVGGVILKTPRSYIKVEKGGETTLDEKSADVKLMEVHSKLFMDVDLMPNQKESVEIVDDKFSVGKIGGISFVSLIDVPKATLSVPESRIPDWVNAKGLDYSIVTRKPTKEELAQ